METTKKDIEMLRKFVTKEEGNGMHFSTYSSIFLFTTENQEEISKVIDYSEKDVLTVASSADQYVSALYYGAETVDMFDINKFTYYMSYLKIAAICRLDYQEFLDFMIPMNNGIVSKKFWDLKTLKKLDILPPQVLYFWENAIYLFKKNGYGNFLYPRHKHSLKENVLRGMPFYSSEEEYYKLQALLRKRDLPKFYLSPASKLMEVVKSDYDIVYLSNIIESMVCEEINKYPYFYHVNEDNIEIDKVQEVIGQVLSMLRKDGDVLVSYRPNTSIKGSTDVLYNNDYFEAKEIPCKVSPTSDDLQRSELTDIILTYNPSRKGNFLG